MSIKQELLRIQQADPENILRPREVLEWAQDNPDSALHRSIDWDDERAAEQHRLWQIRQLIQLHVVQEDRSPVLVSLSIDRQTPGGGYRAISDVVDRPDLRDIMLEDALAELQRVQRKYERVLELKGLWEEADRLREQRKRTKAAKRQVGSKVNA